MADDQSPAKSPETEEKGKGKAKPRTPSTSGVKPFTLKKWNAVAMWRWDVECDTCAICRVQVQGECIVGERGPAGGRVLRTASETFVYCLLSAVSVAVRVYTLELHGSGPGVEY